MRSSYVGPFVEDTTHLFTTPRERHGVAEMDSSNGYSGWPAGNPAFVFVSGGLGDTAPSKAIEYAQIAPGGTLGNFVSGTSQFAAKRDGS